MGEVNRQSRGSPDRRFFAAEAARSRTGPPRLEQLARFRASRKAAGEGHTVGKRSPRSRSTRRCATARLWEEYETFDTPDLSDVAVAYLFLDGVAERLHAGMPREAVLCARGSPRRGGRCCSI